MVWLNGNQGSRNYQRNYSQSSGRQQPNSTANENRVPPNNIYNLPNPFTPLPIYNQPYLPHGTQIPTSYSIPTPILNQPWPTGVASQQHLIAPNPYPISVPLQQPSIHRPYHSNAPYAQPPLHPSAAPQPPHVRTYAQVASQRGSGNVHTGQT